MNDDDLSIITVLHDHGGYMTTSEVSEAVGIRSVRTYRLLKSLNLYGWVEYISEEGSPCGHAVFRWRCSEYAENYLIQKAKNEYAHELNDCIYEST